jgi:hypothetical protein
MSTIMEIERAVQQLPPEELAKFREWFAEFDAAAWDRQIEEGMVSGKLNRPANDTRWPRETS